MYTIPVVCSWCDTFMYNKEGFTEASKDAVSHGMCDECFDKLEKEYKEKHIKTESTMTFGEFIFQKTNKDKA